MFLYMFFRSCSYLRKKSEESCLTEDSVTDSCRDVMHCKAPSPTAYSLAAQATGLRQNPLGVCVEQYKLFCPHYHGRRCERIPTLLSFPQGAEESWSSEDIPWPGWLVSEPKTLHNQHVTRLSPAHPCQEARAVLLVGQPVSRTERCWGRR